MPKAAPASAETPSITINQTVSPTDKPAAKEKEKIDFWTYIAGLSPQDWKRHIVYLYRTKPSTATGKDGKFLEKFQQAFTIDEIRDRFGGEEYKAMLQRDRTLLITEVFAIEAAPKFDLTRENPGNGATAAASLERTIERLIDREEKDPGLEQEAQKRALDLVTKAYDTAAAKLGGPGHEDGSNNKIMFLLLEKLVNRDPMAEMLKFMALAKELGMMGGAGGGNQLEALKTNLGILRELREMDGGGGGGKSDIVTTLIDRAPAILEKVVDGLGKVKEVQAENTRQLSIRANTAQSIERMRHGTVPSAPLAAVPGAPTPENPGAPAAAPIAATPGWSGSLDVVPIDRGTGTTDSTNSAAFSRAPLAAAAIGVAPLPAEAAQLEAFLKNRVVHLIAKGSPAADVIAFIDDFDDRLVEFFATMGEDGLRSYFAKDPILGQAVGLPQWDRWFSEACTELYGEEEPAAARPPN